MSLVIIICVVVLRANVARVMGAFKIRIVLVQLCCCFCMLDRFVEHDLDCLLGMPMCG